MRWKFWEMFNLQGRFCRNFGRKSLALAPFEKGGYILKE
ncbi:unnamed protein product [Prunus brigantina]